MDIEILGRKIIGLAIEVHKYLGPGLLENIYERCLFEELNVNGIKSKRQVPLNIVYKSSYIGIGYYIDLVVEDSLIIELKCVEKIQNIHKAQLLTYLKLSGVNVGYLFNFNSLKLIDGVRRFNL